MSRFQLRDYQVACSEKIRAAWATDKSTLLVLYTGGGKTIIFADVIAKMQPKRALVIAHREELVRQPAIKIPATTGLECGIEMADESVSMDHALSGFDDNFPVVIATVQTLNAGYRGRKRMSKFKPEDFGVLIIDEAHHATSKSYRDVIHYFQQNPELRIMGCTATPIRFDKEALGQVFTSVAADYPILTGIQDGWLCDITQQFAIVAGLDYSHIRTRCGDLHGGDLAAVMEAESNIVGVCQPSLEVLFGLPPHTLDATPVPNWGEYLRSLNRHPRRAIVFTASVLQAELCCNIFNRVLPEMAEWVCGETNKERRKQTLERFANGETRVVMNCAVFTEGFDDPGVEVIIMAKPTKSASLYQQMVGRSTRPLPGVVDGPDLDTPEKRLKAIAASAKPFCRILDFSGNSGTHRLVTCMDILGGKVSDEARAFAIKKAQEEGKPVRVSRTLDKAEIALEQERLKKAEQARLQEEAKRSHLVPRTKYSIHSVDAFDGSEKSAAQPMPSSSGKMPATGPQKDLLRRHGINPDKMSKGQAGAIIGKLSQNWKRKAG